MQFARQRLFQGAYITSNDCLFISELIHRAIMQSGSDRSQWAYIEGSRAKQYAVDLAWELGCPTDDMFRLVQCVQLSRTADEIVNASARVGTRVIFHVS